MACPPCGGQCAFKGERFTFSYYIGPGSKAQEKSRGELRGMAEKRVRTKEELFETYSIPKAVLVLSVPTVLSSLVTVLYSLADTYFELSFPTVVCKNSKEQVEKIVLENKQRTIAPGDLVIFPGAIIYGDFKIYVCLRCRKEQKIVQAKDKKVTTLPANNPRGTYVIVKLCSPAAGDSAIKLPK